VVIVFVLLVEDSDIINAITVRHDKIKRNNALAFQNHCKQQWQALKYASSLDYSLYLQKINIKKENTYK
jgi:hypothetical protein